MTNSQIQKDDIVTLLSGKTEYRVIRVNVNNMTATVVKNNLGTLAGASESLFYVRDLKLSPCNE